ncbi:cis-muuroladiene synthase-like [Salvia splendens]|uniref:cis-muuroladiene synthase-like n=1 Tax=Salvia splendens TaxID=180675 RepID=UPI001C26F438|nr:cis-muuroladiene synthase-like [Salvia splendens]
MATLSCLSDVRPPMTIHQPSIWADTFNNFSFDEKKQQKYTDAIEELKEEARDMLMAATTPLNQMILIDTIERLGLAYLFETEIEHKLQQITHNDDLLHHSDLFTTSLGFRLLRQHRHRISCDVFNKFVNKDGMFEEGDVEEMLSLYEAAHVRFKEEKILQEAADFTRHYLNSREAELESHLKDRVKRALKRPLHRDIPMVFARNFISIYEKDPSRIELFLKLAKLNFNCLQNIYRKELSQVTRWWNKYDLMSKVPYTRDRVVEAYTWGVGYHYEPQYSYVRMGIAKIILFIGVMDDTYDNYATINEAQLFTQILDSWTTDEVDRLPEYMRIVYHFILSVYEEYECDAAQFGKRFAAPYFKEMVQCLGRAYNQELKWIMGRQLPSFQDYLQNSEITSVVYIMFAAIIPGFKSLTQETIDWIRNMPKLAKPTSRIGRYYDDIGTHERESKGGQMLTVMDCYMQEYGVTRQEAVSKFVELIEETWYDINKDWVETTFVPKEIAIQFINYARNSEANYNRNSADGYSDPHVVKEDVVALFINSIVI